MYYMVDVNLRPATNRFQAMRAAGLPAIRTAPEPLPDCHGPELAIPIPTAFAPPKRRPPLIPHVIS